MSTGDELISELALSLEEFTKRYIQPSMKQLVHNLTHGKYAERKQAIEDLKLFGIQPEDYGIDSGLLLLPDDPDDHLGGVRD